MVEAEDAITISGLSAIHVAMLHDASKILTWQHEIYDIESNIWPITTPFDEDFSPYRIAINKPNHGDNTLTILTNAGFSHWLERGHAAEHWHVACITGIIETQLRIIEPWGESHNIVASPFTKSPRALVREYGEIRAVPADIRPWLARDIAPDLYVTPTAQAWAKGSASALLISVADEIDPDDGKLKFRGPPRFKLAPLELTKGVNFKLKHAAFTALQESAKWVFENEREAEMRHILLATEVARCGESSQEAEAFLEEHMVSALESAKIAYQMALADTSRDTLKSLTDLRKAIIEETSKLSELSRQLMAAIASALALGIGLVAARVTSTAPAIMIFALMAVVTVYVGVVIFSGVQFIALQQQLRQEWQPRLYRFLSADDYKKMVCDPAARAEKSFYWTAGIGGTAVLALAMICFWPAIIQSNSNVIINGQAKTIGSGSGSAHQASPTGTQVTKTAPAKSTQSQSGKSQSNIPKKP